MELMSVIVPVYRNQDSLAELIAGLVTVADRCLREQHVELELVFVDDGSPDHSRELLTELLKTVPTRSQLIVHSRNFGTYSAIRSGLRTGRGDYYCILAADLQEPPELVIHFLAALHDQHCDVAVGRRIRRSDDWFTRLSATLFWRAYSRLINPDFPKDGVNIFACTRQFRDELLALREANSSLVVLVYWLGFRRVEVPYVRRSRPHGRSAWTIRLKLAYMADSVLPFTRMPIRALLVAGTLGLTATVLAGLSVSVARLFWGRRLSDVMVLTLVMAFFGSLNLLGVGVIGSYVWRSFENTKSRPAGIIRSASSYGPCIAESALRSSDGSELAHGADGGCPAGTGRSSGNLARCERDRAFP